MSFARSSVEIVVVGSYAGVGAIVCPSFSVLAQDVNNDEGSGREPGVCIASPCSCVYVCFSC